MKAEVTLVLKGGQLKKAMRDGGNEGRKEGRKEGGREGGKQGQRKRKWIDIIKLYKIRSSIESLQLGGGHINPKIHFPENKILVSTLSAYLGFIFTYILKLYFFLKSYQFLYKFFFFFFFF